jgi:hypothetical protein
MNLRLGMFRLWVVASTLFIIGFGAISYSNIQMDFRIARTDYDAMAKELGGYTIYPTKCEGARGVFGSDYSVFEGLCWYKMEDFRRLFPEYKDVSDRDLLDKLHVKVGRPLRPFHPWVNLAKTVVVAIAVPIAVLALGWSLFWAFAGFLRAQS